MNHAIKILIFLGSLLFLSCAVHKKGSNNKAQGLQKRVQQLIDALNQKDEESLNALYADQIESLSPILKNVNKEQLIKETIDNFKANDFEVAIDILEIKASKQMGYAILNWYVVETDSKGGKSANPFKRLTIWEKQKGQWVLTKTLFYQTTLY